MDPRLLPSPQELTCSSHAMGYSILSARVDWLIGAFSPVGMGYPWVWQLLVLAFDQSKPQPMSEKSYPFEPLQDGRSWVVGGYRSRSWKACAFTVFGSTPAVAKDSWTFQHTSIADVWWFGDVSGWWMAHR